MNRNAPHPVTFAATLIYLHVLASPGLFAVDLLSENFDAGDGGFIEEATGNTPIPSIYNSALGTWSMEGDDAGPATNTLTSPPIAVAATAGIRVSFDHRYSIEAEWDGTGLQISIDGGEFVNVPGTAFTQNGYTFSPLIGNHALGGGEGFNGDSPNYAAGDFITSIAEVGGVAGGGTIAIRFIGAWDEGARGTSVPGWEIDSVLVDTLPDGDGDGMPDAYEDLNGLKELIPDADEDPDLDNVTNITEYLQGTDPNKADTDDDGLNDDVETNTGVFLSETDTGTDPLNEDSDGDGLGDKEESNSGTFVDVDDTGTNPNLVDSDGDSITDGIEVTLETDPTDPNDFSSDWVVRNAKSSSGLNSIAQTRALFAGTNNDNETLTTHEVINFRENATGPFAGAIPFPVVGTEETDTEDYAILANGHLFVDDPGVYTFGFNSDDGGGLWIDGEPVVLVDVNRGSATTLGAVDLKYGNHQVEFLYWERGGGAQCQLFAATAKGDLTATVFDVADYALMETSFTEPEDSEPDGLEDGWEMFYFSDLDEDGTGDPDGDLLSNSREQEICTNPADPDSDGDDLNDGIEDGGGVFVSATMTGTDPLDADTDDDGLEDGVEDNGGTFVSATMTGTDPNIVDSDEDTFDDGFEVAQGTDPTDAESFPEVATISIINGLLGGDLTDPEGDGLEGPVDPGPPVTAGTNFNWLSITATSDAFFGDNGGSEGAFDVFDDEVGPGNAKWCCAPAPQSLTVEFEEPVSLTHLTITSSNDTPARDPLDFQIQGSNDGSTFEVIYDRADDVPLWDARNQTVRIDLPAASDAFTTIRYAVTRTGGPNHALNEIEYFGTVGVPIEFKITDIKLMENDMIEITWNSRPNKGYTLFYSTDLRGFGDDENDTIPTGGEETIYTFTNPLPDAERLFFRVEENED